MEGLDQEHRHLPARDGLQRAVVAVAAASRDLLGCELLHPVGEEARAGDISERARARGRRVARSKFRGISIGMSLNIPLPKTRYGTIRRTDTIISPTADSIHGLGIVSFADF